MITIIVSAKDVAARLSPTDMREMIREIENKREAWKQIIIRYPPLDNEKMLEYVKRIREIDHGLSLTDIKYAYEYYQEILQGYF